jgi:Undecaprenyl-phosphate glucose phosphotransferase
MNYNKRDFITSIASKSATLESLENVSRLHSRKWSISHNAIAPVAMFLDAVLIFSMSVISGVVYHIEAVGISGDLVQFCGFAAVVAALFIALGKSHNLYALSELLNLKSQIRKIALTWLIVFLFLTAAAFIMKLGGEFSRGATLLFAASGLATLILARVAWRLYLADGLAVRKFSSRKIVLIAEQTSADGSGLFEALMRHGLQPAHQFILSTDPSDKLLRKEIIAQAISSIRGSNIEEVIVSANLEHWPELDGLLAELRVLPLPVNLIPTGQISDLFRLSSHTIGDTVTIELQRGPRTLTERAAKRSFDLVVAASALVALLPVFLIAAIAVKLDSAGPVIFRQRRCGFNGRLFRIFKFRTMSVLEDGESIIPAGPNDARVTRVGKWLRRTSIDELPQLLNVLRGDMSIVGPRPHAAAHDNEFDKLVGNYAYRHHVRPGLSGWAQVNGYRGEMRTIADIEHRIKLDLWYIDNWSLALDFKIVFMTVAKVLSSNNAY